MAPGAEATRHATLRCQQAGQQRTGQCASGIQQQIGQRGHPLRQMRLGGLDRQAQQSAEHGCDQGRCCRTAPLHRQANAHAHRQIDERVHHQVRQGECAVGEVRVEESPGVRPGLPVAERKQASIDDQGHTGGKQRQGVTILFGVHRVLWREARAVNGRGRCSGRRGRQHARVAWSREWCASRSRRYCGSTRWRAVRKSALGGWTGCTG